MRGEKPENRSVSKNNTSRGALLADPASEKHHTSSPHADDKQLPVRGGKNIFLKLEIFLWFLGLSLESQK